MLTDLDTFRTHLRLDGYQGDDDYIVALLEAAERYVSNYTGRPIEELTEEGEEPELARLLPDIQVAVMMLAAHWYNQREAVTSTPMTQAPLAFAALVNQYVRLVGDDTEEEAQP